MASKVFVLQLVAHVLAASLTVCWCQSEGDVRLVGGANTSSLMGRLDIFWEGKWGTFCELSKKGGDAACRQLGYSEAEAVERYSDYVPKASDDMPIALGSASCGSSIDVLQVPNHVLRCDYSTDTSACVHEQDIVLECSPTSRLYDLNYPYETQLRIVSETFSSTGILEININKQWGNICYSHFDQGAANSACRQLGYTNAASFSSTKNLSSSIVWLSEVQCKSRSCACLSGCFDTPNAPTSCPDHSYLSIQCTFTTSEASKMTPGKYRCHPNYSRRSVCSVDLVLPTVLPIIAVLLCFILTCGTILCVALKVKRQKHRRHQYRSYCESCCCRKRLGYNFIIHPDDQRRMY